MVGSGPSTFLYPSIPPAARGIQPLVLLVGQLFLQLHNLLKKYRLYIYFFFLTQFENKSGLYKESYHWNTVCGELLSENELQIV